MTIKKFFAFILSVSLLMLVVISCSSSTGTDVDVSVGTVKAKVAGSGWQASGATAIKQTVNVGGNSITAVTIAGSKLLNQSSGDNETIEVTIYSSPNADNITETTYNVEEDEIPGAQFSFTSFINGNRVSYFGSSGTVKVTSISDDNVKGTFQGTVVNVEDDSDTKEIKGGEFNVGFGFSF